REAELLLAEQLDERVLGLVLRPVAAEPFLPAFLRLVVVADIEHDAPSFATTAHMASHRFFSFLAAAFLSCSAASSRSTPVSCSFRRRRRAVSSGPALIFPGSAGGR